MFKSSPLAWNKWMPIKLHFSPHKQQHIAKKREGKWNSWGTFSIFLGWKTAMVNKQKSLGTRPALSSIISLCAPAGPGMQDFAGKDLLYQVFVKQMDCVFHEIQQNTILYSIYLRKVFFNKIKNIRPPFSVYHTCIYLGSDLLLVFFSSKNIYIDNVLPFLLHLSLFEWLLFPVFFAIFSG